MEGASISQWLFLFPLLVFQDYTLCIFYKNLFDKNVEPEIHQNQFKNVLTFVFRAKM